MRPDSALPRFLTIVCCGWALSAGAVSGTWTKVSGGSWTNTANWSGATIANGSGYTANFSTLSLTADTTVTLDAALTIGNLSFDDQSTTKHNWSLNTGFTGTLTLAGTTPTVTVGSTTTTVNAVLAGSVGLTKAGTGKLVLGGANTYSGTTTISAGTLALGSVTLAADTANSPRISLLNISSTAVVESSGTLTLNVGSSNPSIDVAGSGILRLTSTTNSATVPDLYFGANHSGATYWGARIAASLDLGSAQRYVFGKTGHAGVGEYGLANTDCQFGGPILGAGGLTFIAQMTWTGAAPTMEVPFALNASNSFTGPVEIRRGSVYLGAAGALVHGNALTLNPAAGNNARLFLYGNNASVSDLASTGAGTALIANGNLKTGAKLTLPAATLTITQNNAATFSGTITDVCPEYDGSGSGTTGPMSIIKNGAASLRLSGTSTYTGTTTVGAGTLQVDGWLNTGGCTVQNGATLSGVGELDGAVTVQSGRQTGARRRRDWRAYNQQHVESSGHCSDGTEQNGRHLVERPRDGHHRTQLQRLAPGNEHLRGRPRGG